MSFGNPVHQIKWMFYKRRIDGCTSVESTVAQVSNRRLNERRIDGYKRRIDGCECRFDGYKRRIDD